MRLEDIPEYGWQYIDDRQQNTIVFSFIDILEQCEEEEKENEAKK